MGPPLRKTIPDTPGVYFFKKGGEVLYVGKATSLRSRVSSYLRTRPASRDGAGLRSNKTPRFQPNPNLSPVKQRMVKDADQITWETTATETEALLLEAHYIKKFQPRYNVLLRDDKTYLSIKITDEEFPRILATRKIEKDGIYIGPFTDARAVKETLKTLRKFFPYRTSCKPHSGRSCLDAHLGLCPGVCNDKISKTEYRKNVTRIKWFLEGRRGKVIESLKQELRKELNKTRLSKKDLDEPVERMRRGTEAQHTKAEKLQAQIYYLERVLALQHVLRYGEKAEADVVALGKELGLATPPRRIEGYDISNLLGQEATASMVVFTNGEADKNEYKKFKIKTVRGANDVAMIKETLGRRFSAKHHPTRPSVANGEGRSGVPDPWPIPDLVVIDGGRPQLNAALEVWREYELDIPLVSLAKRHEEIFTLDSPDPLVLPRTSGALHLVQQVRDEAHRFCRAYHRKLRRRKYNRK